MKLWEFLFDQKCVYTAKAYGTIKNDKEFYKNLGRAEMCDTLYDLLSDETLQLDVKTRAEVIRKKGDKNDPST